MTKSKQSQIKIGDYLIPKEGSGYNLKGIVIAICKKSKKRSIKFNWDDRHTIDRDVLLLVKEQYMDMSNFKLSKRLLNDIKNRPDFIAVGENWFDESNVENKKFYAVWTWQQTMRVA